MKRKLLLMGMLFTGVSLNAQVYFTEDFSSGLAAWTLTDADGDGNDWLTNDYNDGQGDVATSASWLGAPLTPDNWLISPAITVPTASNVLLTWKIYAQDQNWAAENYSVYVATASDIPTLSASTITFNEVLTTSDGYMNRSLDLTALAGSTVYVAFRHHNVSDQFRINLDDIVVQTLPPNEIELVSLSNQKYAFGATNITGTVRNNGANPITSFDIDWNDGTSHSATISNVNIPYGATYDFTHSMPLNAVGGTTHSMTVTATVPNDADMTNNSGTQDIGGVTSLVERVTVGEEKTGTWCPWCPRGTVAMADMDAVDNFIGIAVHNGDPMTVAAYDNNIGTYVPGGYPGAGVDRVETGDPTEFSTMHATRENIIAPGTIDNVDAQLVGNSIEVEVTASFVANVNGDHRIAVVVIENDVTGTASGYAQANNYNGGNAGPLSGAGHDWTTAGNPVPAANMEYDHVARALGGNEILGLFGSLPNAISAGDVENYTYSIPKNPNWVNDNLKFIGMIVDGSTGEILNAGKSSVLYSLGIDDEAGNNFGVKVFPNPANDIAQINVTLEEASNVDVTIYNTAGTIVYNNFGQNLGSGTFVYNVDVKDLAKGLYLVNTTVNGKTTTKKLSVQ